MIRLFIFQSLKLAFLTYLPRPILKRFKIRTRTPRLEECNTEGSQNQKLRRGLRLVWSIKNDEDITYCLKIVKGGAEQNRLRKKDLRVSALIVIYAA